MIELEHCMGVIDLLELHNYPQSSNIWFALVQDKTIVAESLNVHALRPFKLIVHVERQCNSQNSGFYR